MLELNYDPDIISLYNYKEPMVDNMVIITKYIHDYSFDNPGGMLKLMLFRVDLYITVNDMFTLI